jgi:Reverse transcriptase (RNA-dependent DNA polymerase)
MSGNTRQKGVKVPGLGKRIPGLLFADDAAVFAETREDLEEAITMVNDWCERKGLRVNKGKSGVLFFGGELGRSCNAQSVGDIAVLNDYTYLGVNIDTALDPQTIAKRSVLRMNLKLSQVGHILGNKDIPLELRVLILKATVIGSGQYGCELLGLNSTRTQAIQKVAARAIGLTMGCGRRPYCRSRMAEELGIPRFEVKSAAARVRVFVKGQSSKTWFRDLLLNTPKSRKTSWVTGTTRWLNRYVDREYGAMPKNELLSRVRALYEERTRAGDRSIVGPWARGLSLGNGKLLRKLACKYRADAKGWETLFRIRTGTISWTNSLVHMGRLPLAARGTCFLCESFVQDERKHVLRGCGRVSGAQELQILVSKIPDTDGNIERVLLGGGKEAADPQHLQVLLTFVRYLQNYSVARAVKLDAACSSNLPPTVNGRSL